MVKTSKSERGMGLITRERGIEKYIHVKKADRDFLGKVFKVGAKCVYNALHYESDSELANKIRYVARQRGGVVMVVMPEVETMHDCDGYMRQRFANGSMLELSKESGEGDLWLKGEHVRHYDSVKVSDIAGIQAYALGMR